MSDKCPKCGDAWQEGPPPKCGRFCRKCDDSEVAILRRQLAAKDKRIAELESTIKHCDNCGGSWVDDGINSGCYCGEIARLRAIIRKAADYLDEYPSIESGSLAHEEFREASEAAKHRCQKSEGSDGDTYSGCVLDEGHDGPCQLRARPDDVRAKAEKEKP